MGSDWPEIPVADVCNIFLGGTPKRSEPTYWGGSIKWASAKDVANCRTRYLTFTEETITQKGLDSSAAKLLDKNTIVITARGTVGALCMLGEPMSFNQTCYGLVGLPGISSHYLYYALKAAIARIRSISYGTVFDTITMKSFKNLMVPLPSRDQQFAIAHILGSLDDKIELNHQMNQTLEEIGQTIFRHWFVHFEFPNEDGQPYKSSGGEMVDSELGEIPVGWHLRPLDEIANYLNGLALQKYPPENDDYLPVIKIRELNQGITAQTDKASYINIPKEYVIDDGDILFSWSGSLKVVIWGEGKGALNQHLFKVTSEEYPKWFYYYQTLKFLPNFRQIAADKATTMGHIKRSHLKESIVAVPPDNILKQADKILKPIIEQIINNKINSRYLSNIRDSILPKLMSGKIRVNVPEEGTVK